jgi:hypothetical protein
MKTRVKLKDPYRKRVFPRVRHARYLNWEDAFDVEFKDGLTFLEPHSAIRKANRNAPKAVPVNVEADTDLGSHFKVTYDNGKWRKFRGRLCGNCRRRNKRSDA